MGKRKKINDGEADLASESESSPSFEESLAKLQTIIAELESGKLTLDDSLQRYESGVEQLRLCHRSLAQVEQRIRVLVNIDEDGKATTKPFEHQASVDATSNRPSAKGIHADLNNPRPMSRRPFENEADEDQET